MPFRNHDNQTAGHLASPWLCCVCDILRASAQGLVMLACLRRSGIRQVWLESGIHLELGTARCSGEWNDIPDVGNARQEHQHTLKSQAKTTMRNRAKASQFQIPPVVFLIELVVLELLFQYPETFLPLATSDDLPDAWNQYVHGGHRHSICVGSHVKGFDGLGIIKNGDRAFKMFLGQEPFVLGLKIGSIGDRVFKGVS